MAETVYEGMFILESGRYGRDPEGVAGQIAKLIEEAGGEILVSRLWEERRLAYPIKRHRKGTYWLTYFRLDGRNLAPLRRKCRLNATILRMLFLKVDPRIVDTLVEHAKSGHATPRAAKSEADASKKGPQAPDEKKEAAPAPPDAPAKVAEESSGA